MPKWKNCLAKKLFHPGKPQRPATSKLRQREQATPVIDKEAGTVYFTMTRKVRGLSLATARSAWPRCRSWRL